MYELRQITENDYYFDCPAKIGLVCIGNGEVILIDSGNDKDAGKKVYKILQEKEWTLKAIFNTHSHADHIGGNRFLQEKTGCSISSEETLSKYGIGYLWDYKESIRSLERIKELDVNAFVPAHAAVTEDIRSIADYNISKLTELEECIMKLCEEPIGFDDLLEKIFDTYEMTMTAQQHALIGSTVRSFLSSLHEQNLILFSFDGNRMKWEVRR